MDKRLYLNNRENKSENSEKNKKKKFDFGLYKKNTISSLNDIDYFLNNFNHFIKYVKIYRLFK